MEQKSCLRLIYKLSSKQLKKANWELSLPLKTAMRECPDCIVALSESQCLRFIDEINGIEDINESVRGIQRKIRATKKLPKSPETKMMIGKYYDCLYELQFQKDYLCVVMESNSDYDRANQGFSIDYGNGCVIHYRRFLGTNGGIKCSTIVYVNEELYPELKKRLDNGRDMTKELVPAKLEAYQALICSGSTPIPEPNGIIVVKDCITHFKEDVILINDETGDEPVLTHEKDYEFEHNDSDGFGLMLPSYSRRVNAYLSGKDTVLAGMNTRYAWNKGMLYTFDFIDFAEKIAGTYEIVDAWGTPRDIRNAEVILTVSMLKLWNSYSSWEDYYRNCQENHYRFSTPKTTPEELESVRDTNYQFLQSYEFTDDELQALCQPTIDEIQDVLGMDYRKSLVFLSGFGLNEENVFNENTELYVKALMADERMINDPFIRKKIWGMIKKRIEMGSKGSIRVNANFAMISGDPYALAQSMFGLEVTGLLKAGEIYHKYWIDKGADEIACFRAPMTCHPNIRRMKLCKSEEAAYWYQYITTALIYNAWDSACEAMNGADKDGDTNMCTDNPVILRKTKNLPTIVCMQKSAKKKVPTEEDIIAANKLAFNDDIGTITNRVTAMFEVQAGFAPDSQEYKELEYRIMCGQHFQQASIDRAKGIIAKPMPPQWYSVRDNHARDDDGEETIARKEFNMSIVADKKPYFMTYVYPALKKKNNEYRRSNKKNAIRKFWEYKVGNIEDLQKITEQSPAANDYYQFYFKLMPVGINPCVVNRICWIFEKAFHRCPMPKQEESFDYTILKSNVEYDKATYKRIYELYMEYKKYSEQLMRDVRTGRLDSDQAWNAKIYRVKWFRAECEKKCPNESELCDILLDICYQSDASKQFVWDMEGSVIVKNLLNNSGNVINYPEEVAEGGEFMYCGRHFTMRKKEITEDFEIDDYTE